MSKAKKSENKKEVILEPKIEVGIEPKVENKATEQEPKLETKKQTFVVFDKKSNRKRQLTQEEIDLEPTRYRLR